MVLLGDGLRRSGGRGGRLDARSKRLTGRRLLGGCLGPYSAGRRAPARPRGVKDAVPRDGVVKKRLQVFRWHAYLLKGPPQPFDGRGLVGPERVAHELPSIWAGPVLRQAGQWLGGPADHVRERGAGEDCAFGVGSASSPPANSVPLPQRICRRSRWGSFARRFPPLAGPALLADHHGCGATVVSVHPSQCRRSRAARCGCSRRCSSRWSVCALQR